MPSIDFNPLLPGFGRVHLRRLGDRVIFTRPPVRGPLSAVTAAQVLRFREGAAYAKAILRVPARRAPYDAAAKERNQRVYPAIMAELLKNPVIREVKVDGYRGRRGDVVAVLTRADLNIAAVHVRLRRRDNTTAEEGDAVFVAGEYRYTAAQAVPRSTALFVEVTVRDTDGLEVKRSVPLAATG
jgi:hypothetical protein